MTSFYEVFHDAVLFVTIDDDGYAVLTLGDSGLKDVEILIRAINRAIREGAKRGTFFTGDTTNPSEARKFDARAARGRSWFGGKVTRLGDGEFGPMFRVDWDEMRPVTE